MNEKKRMLLEMGYTHKTIEKKWQKY